MEPVLTVRGLRKSFVLHTIGGRRVESLHGVDLDVHAGEHVALAGPSGAGKSSLRRLNLDEILWDVDCGVLSGGERQRVNLAAGTVRPPRLLLLDEPVSALDPANREAALELIGSLAAQGVAVLAVSHDLDAMRRLASRVVLMSDGLVERSGTPAELLAGVS